MLKSTVIRLLFILPVLVFSGGCKTPLSGTRNDPGAISEQFFHYLQNQQYDKAKKLGTEHTQKLLNAVQSLSEMGGSIKILSDNKKEFVKCEIKGDEAVCIYKTFPGTDQKVYLKKIKGKWLVDLRKD